MGAEPDRRHGEGGCPAALELFVIHFLPLSFFLFFCFSLFFISILPRALLPTETGLEIHTHVLIYEQVVNNLG